MGYPEYQSSGIDCSIIRLNAKITFLLCDRFIRIYYSFIKITIEQGRIPSHAVNLLCVILSGTFYAVHHV